MNIKTSYTIIHKCKSNYISVFLKFHNKNEGENKNLLKWYHLQNIFLVFETESFYLVLTLLGNSMYVRLSEDSQTSTCVSLSSTRLRGVEHRAVLKSFSQCKNVLFYMILLSDLYPCILHQLATLFSLSPQFIPLSPYKEEMIHGNFHYFQMLI